MRKATEAIYDWMKSERTPRGWLLLGAVAVFFGQAGLDALRDRSTAHEQKVAAYQMASWELQAFLGSYVDAVLTERDDLPIIRDSLRSEIIRQYEQVGIDVDNLSRSSVDAAHQYRQALFNLSQELDDEHSVRTLGPFWTSAARLIEARNEFLQVLERQWL